MRISFEGVHGEIDSLPGCSQIAVSHGVFVPLSRRNEGKGKYANRQRLVWMAIQGYDVAMCTIDSANEAQKKILEANNWHPVWSFDSSKTGHTVTVYMINLKEI